MSAFYFFMLNIFIKTSFPNTESYITKYKYIFQLLIYVYYFQ